MLICQLHCQQCLNYPIGKPSGLRPQRPSINTINDESEIFWYFSRISSWTRMLKINLSGSTIYSSRTVTYNAQQYIFTLLHGKDPFTPNESQKDRRKNGAFASILIGVNGSQDIDCYIQWSLAYFNFTVHLHNAHWPDNIWLLSCVQIQRKWTRNICRLFFHPFRFRSRFR